MRFVAVVLLILGLVSINSGLTLMGSPFSITGLSQAARTIQTSNQELSATPGVELTLNARNNGYSPQRLAARAGEPIVLNVVTADTFSCARDFVIPAIGFETLLPQSGSVQVNIPAQPAGTVLRFTCSMGMYTGVIEFSQ